MAFRPNVQQGRGNANRRRGQKMATINFPKARTERPSLGPAKIKPAPKPIPKPIVGQSAQPDSAYFGALDRIERQQEHQLGELGEQEREVKHEFGIDDPTNPFSRAESLKRAFLTRQKAASASLASQGQLHSGAHERALARTRREEEQARAELRKAYEGAVGQIGSARTGVKFDTEEERARAFEEWLARAPESEAPVLIEAEAAVGQPPATANANRPAPGLPGGTTAEGTNLPLAGRQVSPGSQAAYGHGGPQNPAMFREQRLRDRLQDLQAALRAAQRRDQDRKAARIKQQIKVVKRKLR